MKLRTRLLGTFGVVAAAALIGVMPAAAAEADGDAAVFVGGATPLTCTPTIVNGINVSTCGLTPPSPIPPGGTNGVPLILGTGTYGFNSTTCVGVSLGGDEGATAGLEVEANTACSVTSTGTYTNVVCGTGLATGNATITEGGGSDTYTVSNYTIVFVGGVGVVVAPTITESEADGDTVPGVGAGVVVLTPVGSAVPPPTGLCVTTFTVVGALVATA